MRKSFLIGVSIFGTSSPPHVSLYENILLLIFPMLKIFYSMVKPVQVPGWKLCITILTHHVLVPYRFQFIRFEWLTIYKRTECDS